MVFPFKEKGFPRKSLCFCVVVLPLCLLKFIHSNIEFFPTISKSKNWFSGTRVGQFLLTAPLIYVSELGLESIIIKILDRPWYMQSRRGIQKAN